MWSRRTKAVLFIVTLLPAEILAAGLFPIVPPDRRSLPYDPILYAAIAIAIFALCDVATALLTFYVRSPTRADFTSEDS